MRIDPIRCKPFRHLVRRKRLKKKRLAENRKPRFSGEGGIRTLGRVAPTPVFEPYPPPSADPGKHGVSAISRAHLNTRIRRRIRLSRTPFPTCRLPHYALGLGSGPAGPA